MRRDRGRREGGWRDREGGGLAFVGAVVVVVAGAGAGAAAAVVAAVVAAFVAVFCDIAEGSEKSGKGREE